MEVNISKILNKNVAQQLSTQARIKWIISNLCPNSEFKVGCIKNGCLNIHTSPHNLINLRRHQDKILYQLPETFRVNRIEWRAELQLEQKSVKKIRRSRPTTNNLEHAAKNCKSDKLRSALLKLKKTLSDQSLT